MKKNSVTELSRETRAVSAEVGTKKYVLKLYVADMGPGSLRAIANVKKICDENMAGRYELEVIDLYQQPRRASEEQITAVPVLIKLQPLPSRRVVGDLSDSPRVLQGLDLPWKT